MSKTTWVQTERKTHEAWAALIHQSPKAATLMHILTSRIGENNAVVVSHKVLAQLMMVKSITTVKQAIKILESGNWIELRQVGELKMPYGDGLPPPSQPFLPDMETNLPATSHTLELEFESEKEKDGAEKLLQMYFDSIRSRGDGYSETDNIIDEELLNMPAPHISDDD